VTDRTPLTYNGAVTAYRQRLLQGDAIALQAITDEYKVVRKNLIDAIADLAADLDGAPDPSDVFKTARYKALIDQIDAEIARLAAQAETVITDGQAAFVQFGQQEAKSLAVLSAAESSVALAAQVNAGWAQLNTGAVRDLVGRLSDGSPLSDYLNGLPNQFGMTIRAELINGLALGKHPRLIRQNLEDRLDGQVTRLLTTTRTAILDSYRSSNILAMQESGVVDEWMWTAALDSRTCAACLALHGKTFPVSESFMGSHPGCRCAPRPIVPGAGKPNIPDAQEFFAELDAGQQDAILGKKGGQAYRDGQVGLGDFVHLDRDPRWGDRYRQGSVKDAIRRAS